MLRAGILGGLYLIQVCTYLLAYYVCFKVRRWSRLPVIAGGTVCFLMVLFIPVEDNSVWYLMIYFLALLTVFIMLWQVKEKPVKRFLELIFLILCLGEVARVIWELFVLYSIASASEDGEYAFIHLVPFVVILLVALVKYKLGVVRLERLKEGMREHIVWLVAVIGIEMLLAVAALNWARSYVENVSFQKFALVVCVLAYVGICMQGVFSLYVAHVNKRIEEAMKYERQLKELQKQHYDMLLEKEEDTRRYRHDMGNLLQNAVEELVQCEGEAFLEISFTQGREHFEIAIRNSLSEVHKKQELNDILKTQKGDKRAHGLGLLNVRETAESMGGRLEIKKEENTFCAIVTI